MRNPAVQDAKVGLEALVREVRTPVDVITAGRALLELAANDYAGVIHLAGNDSLSRLEMAKRIAAHFGLSPQLVVPAEVAKISGRAPRPRDVSLSNNRVRTLLSTPMLSLDAALTLISQGFRERQPETRL
jgi:dTDP-4-dehydrorhamnose reductase